MPWVKNYDINWDVESQREISNEVAVMLKESGGFGVISDEPFPGVDVCTGSNTAELHKKWWGEGKRPVMIGIGGIL